MAAQEVQATVSQSGRARTIELKRRAAIERGDLVSNAPLRARCEWLMVNDPDFSFSIICERMAEQGFRSFVKIRRSRTRVWNDADTSHLLRLLGMRDLAPTVKGGKRYEAAHRTEWIQYDVAVALARSLDMWPVDAGV